MKFQPGYILVEALVASVMFIIIVTALLSSLGFYQNSSVKSASKSEAYLLASEALEVAYNVYLADWNFPLCPTNCYPSLVGGATNTLVTGAEPLIRAKYTRHLSISPVCRDNSTGVQAPCSATANLDPHTRLAQTSLSWTDPTGPQTINLSLLLYNPAL